MKVDIRLRLSREQVCEPDYELVSGFTAEHNPGFFYYRQTAADRTGPMTDIQKSKIARYTNATATMPLIPYLPPIATDAAAVGIGAVCGALCRHHVGQAATKQIAKDPKRFGHLTGWHTAGINVLGSFILGGVFASPLIGAEAAATAKNTPAATQSFGLTPRAKLMAGVGFCGSFTTFSTYSVDIVNMIGRGEAARALGYAMANNVGGVGAAACGMMMIRKLFAGK